MPRTSTDPGLTATPVAPPRASTLALRNLLAKPANPGQPPTPDATPDAKPNDQEPR